MDAHKEDLGSCNRYEGGICAKEGESISIVKRREGRDMRIHIGTIEERIYLTFKVTSDGAGVFCRKERWEKENGAGLQIFKQMDN